MAGGFDISLVYNQLLTLAGQFIEFPGAPGQAPQSPTLHFPDGSVKPVRASDAKSHVGTPIVFPITFERGSYQFYANDGSLQAILMDDFRLPATTICQFSREKIMTRTRISGGSDSVVEQYGITDWQIGMAGVLIQDDAHPQFSSSPYDQMQMLKFWDDLASPIQVQGEFFTWLDIDSIVIKRIDFGQTRGKPNVIPFSISAESVKPLELFIQ